ncbi:integrase, partial [Bacillus cereus]
LVNGSNIQNGKITFNEYLYEWLNVFKKGNVAPRTYMVYEKNIRLHILPVFGELKLKDLTRIKYQKFINNLLEKYSKKTVETINVTMQHALDTAVNELGILEKNPTTKIKLRTTRVSSKNDDIKCYDIDELHQFLTYILNEKGGFKYFSLFMFLSRTGLRIGECLALQWEDIDFEEQKLFINKTLITTKRNEKILFGPPKNRSSKRTISLDSSTISHLRKMKMEQNKNTLKNGKYYKEYNFVFTHEDNSCMLHPATLKFLQQACKKGNLKYITLHGFRHTHAVHLLQSGANLKYVSERLGHSSIDMTANVYLHITKSIEETAVNQYDEFLKSRGQIVGK